MDLLKIILRVIFGKNYKHLFHLGRAQYFDFPKLSFNNHSSDASISIVIPTHNGEISLGRLLLSLEQQKNVEIAEIIVVDSHSTDQTAAIAKQFSKVKVISITCDVFNHGLARNDGSQHTTGKYVLFTVQDAIFEDKYLLHSLITLIESDQNCAAVSAQEKVNTDADAFAQYENLTLYEGITDWVGYRITKNHTLLPSNLAKLRDILFLDNVSAMYKKKIFEKLKGFNAVEHAEDLDFARRAVASGYKLGFLTSKKVTHSHTRPFDYVLKRSYVGYKVAINQFVIKNTSLSVSILTQLQICAHVLDRINNFKGSTIVFLISELRRSKFIFPTVLPSELQFIKDLILKDSSTSIANIKLFYQDCFMQLIINYIKAKCMLESSDLSALKDQKVFLKKLLATYCGEKLALAFESRLSHDTSNWLYKLDERLKSNI